MISAMAEAPSAAGANVGTGLQSVKQVDASEVPEAVRQRKVTLKKRPIDVHRRKA
jgi:hypothetical protein